MKRRLLHTAALALLIFSCRPSARGQAAIAFTGDIIMHIPVKNSASAHDRIDHQTKRSLNNRGYDVLFEHAAPAFTNTDVVVGNMEFPILPPYESRPWIFNGHPAVLDALKKTGFTMMHLANNHILDQGPAGVRHTLSLLTDRGIDVLGVGVSAEVVHAGVVKEIQGIRVGFIGYAGYLNHPRPRAGVGYAINWLYDDAIVAEDIKALKKRCDYLVLVAHTGAEYERMPSARDRALLRGLARAGADLIIGHHPHLLQPAEMVDAGDGRRSFIFYSLGNFISNQGRDAGLPAATQESVIVTLRLDRRGGAIISRFDLTPIRTVNRWDRRTRRQVIQVLSLADEARGLRERLQEAQGPARTALTRELSAVETRIRSIGHALSVGRDLPDVRLDTGTPPPDPKEIKN